ncbi:DUF7668 domain-containing protein [Paraliomyxa miuraensis]|uniref:DUF7668 domain-containing protein n=1 Tax=Paraliomyxa miuraensis TaxID=376150 RepID=UPI0022564D51|nr:hypothetical protein [Paraliomyxa miuraensis]MCX4239120.1 hypothetical protein [Paraliomyxa miuraensis]
MSQSTHPLPAAVKDEDAAHPIAGAWRPTLSEIVRSFVAGDYALSQRPASVAPIRTAVTDQIRDYIADYGETLVELPENTWGTSIAQWMGTHWEVLVDLWTAESGESDLVLSVRVFETKDGFRIEVDSIHVP